MKLKDVQLRLIAAGMDVGPAGADGLWGKGTLTALMAYVAKRQVTPLMREYAAALVIELKKIGVTPDRPLRLLHFLAQSAQETGGFSALVENMAYKTPSALDANYSAVKGLQHAKEMIARGPVAIGNLVYANRNGNGDEESGDGFLYRGRGGIMTTGRTNYAAAEAITGLPLIADPDLLRVPANAALAACAYWAKHKLNDPADRDDLKEVTRWVTGPSLIHMDKRAAYLARGKAIWGL